MTRLILVRHGRTRSNVQGLLDTAAPGPGLDDLGREQAEALIGALAEERIDRIVASPLRRTVATATPLAAARGLPLGRDAGLREVMAGDLEMRGDREAQLAYLAVVTAWVRGDLGAKMPGGEETGAQFLDRFDRAVETSVDGVDTAMCVSHGAAIRTWAAARAVNAVGDFGSVQGLPNAGVVLLDRDRGPWRVTAWLEQRFPAPPAEDPTGAPLL